MRRLLIGLGSLVFALIAAILVVPFFLPKDAIKNQVIAEVDRTFGWRLRLDGPVSLSLFPGFSLTASDIGLSGEAGADGIEFASAERLQVGLAWGGLLGGDIQINAIELDTPAILMEIGPTGLTSWAPRQDLLSEPETAQDPSSTQIAPSNETATPDAAGPDSSRPQSMLARIGIDRLQIVDGSVRYADLRAGGAFTIGALNLTLSASDLAGDVALESTFTWQGTPLAITATLDNPLAFLEGDLRPVTLNLESGETAVKVEGRAGVNPAQFDLALSASGPSAAEALALAGLEIPVDPGAFTVSTAATGSEAGLSLAGLTADIGGLVVNGSVDTDLAGAVPDISGRIIMRDAPVADLLALAGQSRPASGLAGADLAFDMQGADAPMLLATLNLNGSATLENGEIGGLNLAGAFGNDPEADRITDLSLRLDVNGLDDPIALGGALTWRGEAFTVSGSAAIAPILAGLAAPVDITVKSARLAAGFEGQAAANGALDGAVSIETQNLRDLLAWAGQPIPDGGGLGPFKASGLFALEETALAFDETSFALDDTSGRAKGRVDFAGKPRISAELQLGALVLDPYLGGPAQASSSDAAGPAQAARPGSGGSGWSTEPIDFSGLTAADVDFEIKTDGIRWGDIAIGQTRMTTVIEAGRLTARLQQMELYGGQGAGEVILSGAGQTPEISAQFALDGLNAYPALRDAAGFEWLEGNTQLSLDVASRGGSQRALVEALTGSAGFAFFDGAIRGINIPRLVRGLSVETFLGWQDNPAEKTDFSALEASFQIENGIARSNDLSLIGPLVRVSGGGTTDLPNKTLNWKVDPKIVPTLEGQAPAPRPKGQDKKLAGLGVPIVISGPWDNPRIYPDIAGILENPAEAYKQLQSLGGDLISLLNATPEQALADTANEVLRRATGGNTQFDVQKVIEGEVDDQEILEAVEEGFGLPPGMLRSFGFPPRNNDN